MENVKFVKRILIRQIQENVKFMDVENMIKMDVFNAINHLCLIKINVIFLFVLNMAMDNVPAV